MDSEACATSSAIHVPRPSARAAIFVDLLADSKDDLQFKLTRLGIIALLREVIVSRENPQLVPEQRAVRTLDVLQEILDDLAAWDPSAADDTAFLSAISALFMRLAQQSKFLPATLFLDGVVIDDRDPLKLGGFADVFQGSWGGKVVALKRLRVSTVGVQNRDDVHHKIYWEALIWRQLHHHYVLPFLGIDRSTFARSSLFAMVSPWMSQGSVLDYATRDIGLPERLRLLREVAEGMAYLHSRHVVHGDIRGSNIFVDDELHIKLADFGISVIGDKAVVGFSTATRESSARRWMAAELLDPDRFGLRFKRTSESDTFAFGGLSVEIFTGRHPFSDVTNDITVMLRQLEGESPKRPSMEISFGLGVPDGFWELRRRCWAYSPAARPRMQDVATAIRNLITLPSRAHPSTPALAPATDTIFETLPPSDIVEEEVHSPRASPASLASRVETIHLLGHVLDSAVNKGDMNTAKSTGPNSSSDSALVELSSIPESAQIDSAAILKLNGSRSSYKFFNKACAWDRLDRTCLATCALGGETSMWSVGLSKATKVQAWQP